MAIAAEIKITPAVYWILTNKLANEKFVLSGIHTFLQTPTIHVCLSHPHSSAALEKLRHSFLDHILTVDESGMLLFDPQLKQKRAE